MSDKKQEQQQQCTRSEERKNDERKSCDDSDRMVFPDEKLKVPSGFENRNFANSNTNPGYGTGANGEVVEEFK